MKLQKAIQLINAGKAKEGMTIDFTDSHVTQEELEAIADIIKSKRTPKGLRINLSSQGIRFLQKKVSRLLKHFFLVMHLKT